MAKLKIVTVPDQVLSAKSKKITHIDAHIRRLANDMIDTLASWGSEHETGAAIAACQVGENLQLVVIGREFEDKPNDHYVLINPEIVKHSDDKTVEFEGCLSVPQIYGKVPRYSKVKVKAADLDGKEFRMTAEGFLARVFQHEIDHLSGVVFTSKVENITELYQLGSDGKFHSISS